MSNAVEIVDNLLGSGTEEAIYDKAYKQGFDEGSQEGSKEGWGVGVQTGAEVGFELGKYKGFAEAVRDHLQNGKAAEGSEALLHSKSVRLCEKIIKLVDEFNWENITSIHDASAQVRTQYQLLRSQLGVPEEQQAGGNIPGQKFSF